MQASAKVWKNRNVARVFFSAQVAMSQLQPQPDQHIQQLQNKAQHEQKPLKRKQEPQPPESLVHHQPQVPTQPQPQQISCGLPNRTPKKEKSSPNPQSLRTTISPRYSSRSRPSHSPSKFSRGLPNQTPKKKEG